MSGNAVGADYSNWNGPNPNLNLDFVIVLADQGTYFVNQLHDQVVAAARKKSISVGHYHFGVAGDGVAQAKHFLATANPRPGDFLALDWEWWSPEMTAAQCLDFLDYLAAKVPECKRGIYTSAHFSDSRVGGATRLYTYDLWYVEPHGIPKGWPAAKRIFRQTSYAGGVDHDEFNGSPVDLRMYLTGTGDDMPLTPEQEAALNFVFGVTERAQGKGQTPHAPGNLPHEQDGWDWADFLYGSTPGGPPGTTPAHTHDQPSKTGAVTK